jgi:hypothetical protein
MKVNPLANAVQYFSRITRGEKVEEKGTPEQANRDSSRRHSQKDSEKENQQNAEREASPEEIAKAIDAFAGDTLATSNGLHAEVEGAGPGLRVVLKDVSGQVLRQYTGEEFVKLRDDTQKDQRTRGKILDQKL